MSLFVPWAIRTIQLECVSLRFNIVYIKFILQLKPSGAEMKELRKERWALVTLRAQKAEIIRSAQVPIESKANQFAEGQVRAVH